MKNSWKLLLFFATAFPFSASAQVVFSEIMYDLPDPGGDSGREWFEIYNNSAIPIDMTGWTFFENDTNHKLTAVKGSLELPAGGYAVVADTPETFISEHQNYSGILLDSSFSLNNSGERIALKNKEGVEQAAVAYTSAWGAQHDGASLQYFNGRWGSFVPTPGTENKENPIPTKTANISAKKKDAPAPVASKKSVIEHISQTPTDKRKDTLHTAAAVESVENKKVPLYVWWALLVPLFGLAGVAYWAGGRNSVDEFEIIEEEEIV
jgi:hypothetical protein